MLTTILKLDLDKGNKGLNNLDGVWNNLEDMERKKKLFQTKMKNKTLNKHLKLCFNISPLHKLNGIIQIVKFSFVSRIILKSFI